MLERIFGLFHRSQFPEKKSNIRIDLFKRLKPNHKKQNNPVKHAGCLFLKSPGRGGGGGGEGVFPIMDNREGSARRGLSFSGFRYLKG